MGWLCTLRALLPRPLRNWKLVKATAQLPASASQHNTTTQDFTSHAHRARRSNNAAVDRVGGLLGFRAHMEEQTIYRECTGECCPRHCHVVASIQYATWRYGSFQRVCAVQGFFLGWDSCAPGWEVNPSAAGHIRAIKGSDGVSPVGARQDQPHNESCARCWVRKHLRTSAVRAVCQGVKSCAVVLY